MRLRHLLLAASLANALPAIASATNLVVVNPSFETQTVGEAFFFCGTGCVFSTSGDVGWTSGGGGTSGQFIPGVQAGNFTYVNYVPDAITVGYTAGVLSQTIGATARAGATYTLTTQIGYRKDFPSTGDAALMIGNVLIPATGVSQPGSGNFSLFTATYTAVLADEGAPIQIILTSTDPTGTLGRQGLFDAVQLTGINVPEPTSWVLMLIGFAGLGVAIRRRRGIAAAA